MSQSGSPSTKEAMDGVSPSNLTDQYTNSQSESSSPQDNDRSHSWVPAKSQDILHILTETQKQIKDVKHITYIVNNF